MNWRKIAVVWMGAWTLGYLVWLIVLLCYSPESQMLRMQNKFIAALETKSWWTADSMISNDYSDTVNDGGAVRIAIRQALGGFTTLKIKQENVKTHGAWSQGKVWLGEVVTHITVEGTGTPQALLEAELANGMKKPWFFHWHKRGFWPWSWELMQIHNDDLAKAGAAGF